MSFHPRYFDRGVRNGTSEFNYYEWNAVGRKDASKHIATDTRKQPHADEALDLEPSYRVVCPAGGAIVFSGAQMHATVPNTSGRGRFSMDYRTVNLEDVVAGIGAAN